MSRKSWNHLLTGIITNQMLSVKFLNDLRESWWEVMTFEDCINSQLRNLIENVKCRL